ncbi:MAG TPA: aspartate aminotransferase family protein [Burkholderiales bacterium]|nr:aspartate aminotransferase family protein [Burkholderiales bacterium]
MNASVARASGGRVAGPVRPAYPASKTPRWSLDDESSLNPDRRFLLAHIQFDKPIVRASGHYLYDEHGNAYLDFLAQYGAIPFGHNPPALWDAVTRVRIHQEPSLVQPLISPAAETLAAKLVAHSPCGPGYVTFTNSGAESVEAAIKLARAKTHRQLILSTHRGFHGKTLGALSATGTEMYRAPFLVDTTQFGHVPYGDLDALAQRLASRAVAAFVVEPVQGEAGMIAPPPGYLVGAQALCKAAGTLLVLDEIQTGLGRTGKLFAAEHDGVKPDIVLLAKALGGGLVSLGACLCSERAWAPDFGVYHSSTFANNHLSCAIGVAVLDELVQDDQRLVQEIAAKGAYLRRGLERLVADYPDAFSAVDGLGLMQGLRTTPWEGGDGYFLAHASSTGTAVPLICGYLMAHHRILTAPTFNHSGVLRIEPPLTITRPEIDRLLLALEDVAQLITRGDFARLLEYITGTPEETAADPHHQPIERSPSHATDEPVRAVSR